MGRLPPLLAPGSTSAMPVRASRRPTKVPQVFALRAHHKEPTDETGLGGTRRHCRYDGAVGPLTSTYAGELGLSRCLRDHGLNGDGTPEKRKVGGSTPPLTTRTQFDLRKRRLRERPLAPLVCGTRRSYECGGTVPPRQPDQPAMRAFPLVSGSLWSDLVIEGSHLPVVPMSVRLCARLWGG